MDVDLLLPRSVPARCLLYPVCRRVDCTSYKFYDVDNKKREEGGKKKRVYAAVDSFSIIYVSRERVC